MKRCVCLLSVVVAAAWSVVGLSAEKPSSFSEMQSNFKDEERALRRCRRHLLAAGQQMARRTHTGFTYRLTPPPSRLSMLR